ncbi:MAG: SRPBCC family protein [Nitrososphaerales archaeon]|jgi:hypothetical protein
MEKVQATLLIETKPEAVWEVLVDANYIPKLYPDMLNITVDPPGRASMGQYRTLHGRAGKRLIEFKDRVTEMVPLKRFVIRERRGGSLEYFSEVIELEEVPEGTVTQILFEYKVSQAYFGPAFDLYWLTHQARLNLELFIRNLKELAELRDPSSGRPPQPLAPQQTDPVK